MRFNEIRPSLNEVRDLRSVGNLVSVYTELPSDLETPVSTYLKLSAEAPSFLLDSVEGGERVARYSYVGIDLKKAYVLRGDHLERRELIDGELRKTDMPFPENVQAAKDRSADFLDALREELLPYRPVPQDNLPPFAGGLVGYTGYDVVRQFERLPCTARDLLNLPDVIYLFADTLVAFDHAWQRLMVIANMRIDADSDRQLEFAYHDAVARIRTIKARLSGPCPKLSPRTSARCTAPRSNKTQQDYEETVKAAKELVVAGDIFQVVLSRRIARETVAHPFEIYRSLRSLNPSPWMFFFDFGQLGSQDGIDGKQQDDSMFLIGASPELHARFDSSSRIATVTPIAGTRQRGATEDEDERLAAELLQDPKEKAEHTMLVDLARNDIGRIAKYGTMSLPEVMTIEKYSHVMHIVSRVEGEVRDEMDGFDVLRATFPAGTLTGAPKIRAMQIIEDLEGERRGPYGGCTGWISFRGDIGTCITIRTIVMHGSQCFIQSGAGIVADSDPKTEFEETENKARALMQAIDDCESQL